jgi:large subunit ribosomal protein L28
MSNICEITGKGSMKGNKVSHSNRKTKRLFRPNLQKKTFFIPEEGREITLKVSAEGLKHINKKGISAAVKEAREKGYLKK